MNNQRIKIEKTVDVDISEEIFTEYLLKNNWTKEHGLWRHKSGHQFAPLNLTDMRKSIYALAMFENVHVFDMWCKIMQPENERNK